MPASSQNYCRLERSQLLRTELVQIGILLLLSGLSIFEGVTIITENAKTYGASLAGSYVIALGSILAVMTVLLTINNWEKIKDLRLQEKSVPDQQQVSGRRKVWLLLLLVSTYVLLIDYLGYTLCTILFFIVFLRFSGGYSWRKTILYSILFGIVFGFIFMQVGMALPTGIFG